MTRFHQSLKLRIVALAVIILIVIIAVIHSTVYVTATKLIDDQVAMYAQGIAAIIAHRIQQDIEGYKGFLAFVDEYKVSRGYQPLERMDKPMPREYYEHNEYYQRMQEYFQFIIKNSYIKYIFTERQLCKDFFEYILDGEPIGSKGHSPPGEYEELFVANRDAFEKMRADNYGLSYYGEWGYLVGAYVPIVDQDGTFLGLIGINLCGNYLQGYLDRLQIVLFAIYAIIIGLVLFVLPKFSGAILEPLLKDKLTGAYTKRYAEKLIQGEIAIAVRERSDLTLMVLDLDHFKKINDTYGHNFGDKVLTSVSRTIQAILRSKDYFIRFGGEEFIALFPKVNEKRAMEIAERMRHTVEENEIFNEEKDTFINMTISIGVATLNDTAPSVRELIEHADKALYIAKQTRNTVSLYTQGADIHREQK